MVTEWKPEQYEGTRTVYKTEWKEENYTYYTCERVAQKMTRTVNYTESVPETHDVVVSRWECVPTQEERTVTRYTTVQKPYTYNTTRCVDKGGQYETREVACHTGGCGGCGHGRRFGRRHGGCGGCGGCGDCGGCAPTTTTVSVYVPNYVTETVPVTVMRTECVPHQEKVMVTVNRMVEKKETVKVTTYRCVVKSRPEEYTVWTTHNVPHQGTRKVPICVPSTEKVMLTRMVPVQVEREVTVCTSACGGGGECGGCGDGGCGHRGHRLFGGRRGCH
jgi:hypothetical protein